MSTTVDPANRQGRIAIIPTSPAYADQMEDLGHTSYGTSRQNPDQVLTAPMFREHVNVFPEGQFTAIDTTSDSVVGLTVSMRMDFDPTHHHTEQWWSSIGYG
jgi:hypothetical protein